MALRWQSWGCRIVATATLAGFVFTAGLSAETLAQDRSGATAALPGDDVQIKGADLPKPLDAVNADRYRDIFRLQAAGDFRGADRVIAELTDQSLLGQVLADRYLSATYISKPKELADWLRHYDTLADARAIYQLAQVKGASNLTEPKVNVVRIGSPDESYNDRDATWLAGVEAWRRGDFAKAAEAFVKDTEDADNEIWDKAKSSFWAARAYLRAKQPEKVSTYLRKAAKHPLTFYGQLATRALGIRPQIDWTAPKFTKAHGQLLLSTRSGKRALALIQVGQLGAAEKELLLLESKAKDNVDEALLAVADIARMPSLALKLGAMERLYGDAVIPAALFPVPRWEPKDGFTIDRALLYAIIRQESGFNPLAVSGHGALGLMQIMPETGKKLGYDAAQLKNPRLSMAAGQKYIAKLLSNGLIKNDIILMAVAYNGGAGNLQKWKNAPKAMDDPLLFLETLPSKETRQFTKRILAAYWIYQERLGQETPTLKALATGGWAQYIGQDSTATASK
ncbi:lytic transglycosylase domain-containing protein [Dongia deserti]|uniref:lytic transglycosylase domain-containing protein n=1 Tax=Dongia deserti TaxID=2268030 RepID=UPI000E648B59|nr:lytic transglycosylase domain-containing protein [Dongia deserti]